MANVVITGGSRGIGAAAVALFAQQGHRVTFLYEKNHEAAQAVAKETGSTAICCDVADKASVDKAFEQIGDVDILICNAGIMHFAPINMVQEDTWDRLFAVNVKGIYNCVNAALPSFLKKQSGSIITVSERIPTGGVVMFALMAAGGDLGASVGPELVGIITDFVASNPRMLTVATDLGMTGPRNGVLGVDTERTLTKMRMHMPAQFVVADGEISADAIIVETDGARIKKIERISF